jgi:uncharacterized protein (DUF1499 family)
VLSLLHFLVGLFLPACGATGAAGLAVPALMDVARIVRPASPNTALAGPAGFAPAPDIVTRDHDVAPAILFAAIERVAAAQARVFPQARFAERMQAHFVARSRLMNYPDLITAQVTADGRLILWSRSVYGHSDLGVNRARIEAWLTALDAELTKR